MSGANDQDKGFCGLSGLSRGKSAAKDQSPPAKIQIGSVEIPDAWKKLKQVAVQSQTAPPKGWGIWALFVIVGALGSEF